jgi:hypothetical protein
MNFKRNALLAAMGLVLAAGSITTASAETRFAHQHPRRAEVTSRVAVQTVRIRQERRLGEITAARAHRLHAADHRIARQENRFARRHDGRITLAEQQRLNREENHVNRQIIRR